MVLVDYREQSEKTFLRNVQEDTKEVFRSRSLSQSSVKSIRKCKKNPYIINQNHIFNFFYCEVISG
jgi:hypothetical protein